MGICNFSRRASLPGDAPHGAGGGAEFTANERAYRVPHRVTAQGEIEGLHLIGNTCSSISACLREGIGEPSARVHLKRHFPGARALHITPQTRHLTRRREDEGTALFTKGILPAELGPALDRIYQQQSIWGQESQAGEQPRRRLCAFKPILAPKGQSQCSAWPCPGWVQSGG